MFIAMFIVRVVAFMPVPIVHPVRAAVQFVAVAVTTFKTVAVAGQAVARRLAGVGRAQITALAHPR